MAEPHEVEARKFLSDKERELVLFIERFHSLTGVAPDENSMVDYLKSINYKVSKSELSVMVKEPLFVKSMEARGIVLALGYKLGQLTIQQMTAAAVMTNHIDRRSDEKKLRDMGITTQEWSSWMLDEQFVSYLQGRVEKLLGNSVHEAHMGLIRGAKQGNVPAIKLLYEITNRYNPDKESTVNVRMILNRVVEIIQKHVKDPEILVSMAQELTQLAIEASPVAEKTIPGMAVARR